MINIQDSRDIKYDGDRKSVTVYRDFSNTNLWYIVPQPQLATQTVGDVSVPAFTLTEFRTNSGSAGTVTFTVELVTDKDAYQAARNALGPNAEFGQFTWADSQVYLTPVLPSIEPETQLNVTPSNYGANSATFIVELASTADVNAVRSMFGSGSGISSWSIQYVATTLCQLPAVKATVSYDCSIAASYQKTVQIDRNVWGSETGRRTTIREYMQKSDSGKVDLVWSVKPSDELAQRVHDWAFTTLEGLVQSAADDVASRLGANAADDFNISSIGSFKRIYEENQVTDWTITPQGFLPAFNADDWRKMDRVVDNRTLSVSIAMRSSLQDAGIQQVFVTIDYPGKAQPTSYTFTPNSTQSFLYESEGAFIGNVFNPEYTYWYKVNFNDGNSFETPHLKSRDANLNLTYTDLGYQTVAFACNNIDFATPATTGTVDFILIDFTYRPDATAKLYIDQQRVERKDQSVVFTNRSFMASSASYIYAVTYVLTDKTTIVDRPISVLGIQNAHSVTVTSAIGQNEFTVTAINDSSDTSNSITGVSLKGTYTDNADSSPQRHTFQQVPITNDFYSDSSEYVGLVRNDYASVQFEGTVLCKVAGKSQQVPVRAVRYGPDADWTMFLQPVQVPFTVTFDPSLIDWSLYSRVLVDVFRSNKILRLKSLSAVPDADKYGQVTIVFSQPDAATGGQASPAPYYYTFSREVGASAEIYYSATYYDKQGNPSYLPEVGFDSTTVLLPARAPSHASGFAPILQVAVLPVIDFAEADVEEARPA